MIRGSSLKGAGDHMAEGGRVIHQKSSARGASVYLFSYITQTICTYDSKQLFLERETILVTLGNKTVKQQGCLLLSMAPHVKLTPQIKPARY